MNMDSIFKIHIIKQYLLWHFRNSPYHKVSKGAKIRNRYNQVQHLTQDTNGESDKLTVRHQSESQEVRPFPAGDHKAHINRHAQRLSKHKAEQKHKKIKDPQKKYRLGTVSKIFYWKA